MINVKSYLSYRFCEFNGESQRNTEKMAKKFKSRMIHIIVFTLDIINLLLIEQATEICFAETDIAKRRNGL